ncbi:MAG: HmuY family protein [Bacteroidales bacterium]|nr:HmuY family protein [Bacteroidales bacterium]
MKIFKLVLVALVSLVMVAASCSKDDDVKPEENVGSLKKGEVTLSRKTDYGNDWIYYSFKEAKEVAVAEVDHETSLDWDIAFNRYNVRTNGGESGAGQAAVYDAGKVDFTSVLKAPTDGYVIDDTIQIVKAFLGQSVEWMTSTGNDAFKGCVEMSYGSSGPSYNTNDHIYVVKTADGKYAKLWIKSYYNDNGVSGFINFKYSYQSEEGTELE